MGTEQATARALKVTAVPIVSALGRDEKLDDLEVLVRVEAPLQVVAKHPPVDLVAVVDVSESTGWLPDQNKKCEKGEQSRMEYLKAALRFIVDELDDDDRLSIVQFNESVKDSSPLSPISGGGREWACRLVDSLTPEGRTAFKPALEEAVSILQDRDQESRIRRMPFIVFLSDGEETEDYKTQWDQVIKADSNHPLRGLLRRYPVHTFGFSSFHEPMPLLAIATVSCGTYSYIDGQGLDKITDAFAVCLGGLTTVVAVDTTIALSATAGVTIVDIDAGGYNKRIKKGRASGEVCIPVLYEGEVKNFIVHLRVLRAEAAGEQLLLTADGTYVDAVADHGASPTIIGEDNHHRLSIQRPAGGDHADDGQQRDEAVLEQVTRFKLLSLLEELPKDKQLRDQGGKWAQWLTEKWNELKNSYSLSNSFDKDVVVMVGKLEEGFGQSFVCSYVSSRQMERATIMGSPGNTTITADYKTPAITRMAEKAATQKPAPAPPAPSDAHAAASGRGDVDIDAHAAGDKEPPPPEVPLRSWKEWLSSASWLSVTSGAWNNGEMVKVEAFTGSTKVVTVVGDSQQECTPVLVRVTAGAPWRRPRTPVDIVAVLNISRGMKGSMERMQEAMAAIVSNLDNKDRLSIVTLEDVASEEMGLVRMDSKGRATASDTIKRITSRSMFRECDENLSKEALKSVRRQIVTASEAAQDRLRCVMLLSGSQDQDKLIMEDWIAESKEQHSFQFHAFNLGAQDDAGRFLCIADQGVGTYHYLADAKIITDAFTAFVGGLKSVVATSVKLSLKAEAGFSISSVEAGGHCWWDGSSKHGIHIADMHAGEQRSFMVYLIGGGAVQEQDKLLSIDAEYLLGLGSSKKTPPCLLRGKDVAMKSEVAAEIVRVNLMKQVKEMVAKPEAHKLMDEKWEMIRASAEYEDARGMALLELIERDVDEMMKPQCQPHMLSWISCHWWQRATAMPHYTCAFRARATTTHIGGARSCIALGIAAGVVLAFLVLMLLRLLVGWHWQQTNPKSFNVVTAPLDIVNHPQWPAMKDDLSAMLHSAKEDRIISFFEDQSASQHDMNQQMDQYLYMAILHAAALRARYDGTATSFPMKVVRSQAEAYLQGMLKRTKNNALPALQVTSVQDMSDAMSQNLYSTIVQAQVLVTMHLPRAPPPDNATIIEEMNATIIEQEQKIKEQEAEIVTLRIQIVEMQNCCQLANRCAQHVKELGGSADYFGDYVKKTTYSFEFERKKELSAHEAVEHGHHQKIKELGAVEHMVDELVSPN